MTEASEGKRDFFVSYTSGDEPWAEWLVWAIEEAGWSVWFQKWDFRGNFVLQMDRSNDLSDRTIGILSARALGSKQVQAEWDARRAVDPRNERESLILIKVGHCEVPGLLKPFIWLDLTETDPDTARAELVAWLTQHRRKPDKAPLFPCRDKPTQQPRFPGSLPPIWKVPDLRNPYFTGRDELLESLHRTLTEGPTALTALSGMGGIGKTQLALEYTYRHHSEFDIVWWLRAEEQTTLLADYVALAGELRLPGAGEWELSAVAQTVRRALEKQDRWLLVFDNVHEEGDLSDLLPKGGGGRVLITSRNPSWDRATPLEVPLLGPASSVAFLLKRTKQGDETTAAALAMELGDLPLALEQAAAFVERRAITMVDYLANFRAHREKLWQRERPPRGYPDTVRTTWSLAVARLKQEEPWAIDLLNLAAFLAPEAIPRWLFAEHGEALPSPLSEAAGDTLRWSDLVEALRSYSLVWVADGSLTFHRLVQAVTRDALGRGHS